MFVVFGLEAPTKFSRTTNGVDDFPPVLKFQDSVTFPVKFVFIVIWLPEIYDVWAMYTLETAISFERMDLFTELIKNQANIHSALYSVRREEDSACFAHYDVRSK